MRAWISRLCDRRSRRCSGCRWHCSHWCCDRHWRLFGFNRGSGQHNRGFRRGLGHWPEIPGPIWRRALSWRRDMHWQLRHGRHRRQGHGPGQILHDIAQRWRGARLHPLACPGQHIFCRCGRCRLLAWRLIQCGLQGPDCRVKGQALRLQHLRRGAAAIANNRGQNDSTVDVAPPPAPRRRGCGFQDPLDDGRDRKAVARAEGRPGQAHQIFSGLALDARDIDMTGIENTRSIGIIAKCRQQVFECDFGKPLGASRVRRPRQRLRQHRRHRNLAKIRDRQGRHTQFPRSTGRRARNHPAPHQI